MKIAFSTKPLDEAPPAYVRVVLSEQERGTHKFVQNGKNETLEIGTGKRALVSRRQFITLYRKIVRTAKTHRIEKLALELDLPAFPQLRQTQPSEVASLIAQNFEMANYEFDTHKTTKKSYTGVREILLCGAAPKEVQQGFVRGQTIAGGVNAARALSNTPGGHLTPKGLAQAAKAAANGLPITVTTLQATQLKKLGMGLLSGVGAGSPNEPTFTVMTYEGGKKTDRPIVLIGKGITFDAGGLNLKPSSGIYEMHMDMSGAAAVIHTVVLAARLKLTRNVIALIPAAENLVGPHATRPGDIHTSLSGKTVEITDTDAEGRLVLADALTYAKRCKPAVVLDAATLTGASLVALGFHASGLMTRDEKLSSTLVQLGEETGEYVWPLPLWDEYESVIKSDFADLQNHSISQGRYGGATNGAIFLWQFAKELDCPWAHLDIAPRMTSTSGDELAKGAAGAPVRLLLRFIETWDSK